MKDYFLEKNASPLSFLDFIGDHSSVSNNEKKRKDHEVNITIAFVFLK